MYLNLVQFLLVLGPSCGMQAHWFDHQDSLTYTMQARSQDLEGGLHGGQEYFVCIHKYAG